MGEGIAVVLAMVAVAVLGFCTIVAWRALADEARRRNRSDEEG